MDRREQFFLGVLGLVAVTAVAHLASAFLPKNDTPAMKVVELVISTASAIGTGLAVVVALYIARSTQMDQTRSARRVVEVFATELWQELFSAVLALEDRIREDELPVVLTELREMLATTSQLRIELLTASRVSAWIAMRAIASMAAAELAFVVSNMNTSGFHELERERRTKNIKQLLTKLEDRLDALQLSSLIAHDEPPRT